MRSYEAARRHFSFLEGIAVLAKIGGVILAFIMVSMAAELIERSPNPFPIVFAAAVPGVVLFLMGSFFQAQVQANRASVDSAEYAQQSLKIARDQFAFSKQVHAHTMGVPVETYASFEADETLTDISFDTDEPKTPAAPGEPRAAALEVIEHNGVQIEKLEDGYRIDSYVFVNIEAAKQAAENPVSRQFMAIRTEPA